jgi:hypothetical protein
MAATYGEADAHPNGYTDVRDPGISLKHPSYAKAVGSAMPTSFSYDSTSETLNVGAGQWTHVTPEVAAYTVGGTNVINSWLDYRLAEPRKRKTSPLDKSTAPMEFGMVERLSNLLSVVTQLVDLTETRRTCLVRSSLARL